MVYLAYQIHQQVHDYGTYCRYSDTVVINLSVLLYIWLNVDLSNVYKYFDKGKDDIASSSDFSQTTKTICIRL